MSATSDKHAAAVAQACGGKCDALKQYLHRTEEYYLLYSEFLS